MESVVSVQSTYHNNTASMTSSPLCRREEKKRFHCSFSGAKIISCGGNEGWQREITKGRSKFGRKKPLGVHIGAPPHAWPQPLLIKEEETSQWTPPKSWVVSILTHLYFLYLIFYSSSNWILNINYIRIRNPPTGIGVSLCNIWIWIFWFFYGLSAFLEEREKL